MKALKSHIQLTALVLSFVFTNTVLAAEPTTAENKDKAAVAPVAQVDTAAVSAQLASKPQTIDDTESYRKQMDERRQQAEEAQQAAYESFLERRKENIAAFNNNIPADAQERHNEFIKQMEQRRALNINESKDDKAADTSSPVAQVETAGSAQLASQPQTIDDTESYRKQMDEHRQQAKEAQQAAYESFLERRKENIAAFNNNIPADAQERHNEFIKQMEQRRALNIKMMEKHRKAAEERRAAMQLKMKRTSTTPESAGKA